MVVAGQVTQPRNVEVVGSGRHSLEFGWEDPECGSIVEYEWRLLGESDHASFELHRGTSAGRAATLRNLLPGTRYRFLLRAIDSAGKRGPFTSGRILTLTEGDGEPLLSRLSSAAPRPHRSQG